MISIGGGSRNSALVLVCATCSVPITPSAAHGLSPPEAFLEGVEHRGGNDEWKAAALVLDLVARRLWSRVVDWNGEN
ncbi:hypothetical protein [Herbidospora sp. RD11066]